MKNHKSMMMIIVILWITGCRSVGHSTPSILPVDIENDTSTQKGCGDGVCDGPETVDSCPADCRQDQDMDQLHGQERPPLYFFYVIHAHGSDEFLPYTGPAKVEIDTVAADHMISTTESIAGVMDRYGVKGTWQYLPSTVEGLHQYQGLDNIMTQLLANGHEIGVHTHKLEDIAPAVEALQDIGISPRSTSGFLAQVTKVGAGDVQGAMSLAIQLPIDLGLDVGTANLSPGGDKNTVSSTCQNVLGSGNDMWQETGNLMFPWRPDYIHQDVCTHNPEGEMLIIDHVSIEWIILPDSTAAADVLDSRHFNHLRERFDAALRYLEENQPDRPATWGFVTHIIEYSVGGKMENLPLAESLAALDNFLSYVDSKYNEGLVVYATASEIADLIAASE